MQTRRYVLWLGAELDSLEFSWPGFGILMQYWCWRSFVLQVPGNSAPLAQVGCKSSWKCLRQLDQKCCYYYFLIFFCCFVHVLHTSCTGFHMIFQWCFKVLVDRISKPASLLEDKFSHTVTILNKNSTVNVLWCPLPFFILRMRGGATFCIAILSRTSTVPRDLNGKEFSAARSATCLPSIWTIVTRTSTLTSSNLSCLLPSALWTLASSLKSAGFIGLPHAM